MTALLFLSAILIQSPECSISGRVLNLSTGEPLEKADVRLIGPGVPNGLNGVRNTTDVEGNFRFDHLGPGEFRLFAERNGYLNTPGARASCGSGDLAIKMTPQGMICGKVIDDDGEPVPSAYVVIYRTIWNGGHRQLATLADAFSQADGTFVFGKLASGNYYLSARHNVRTPSGEVSVDNFFPNTADEHAASPVRVIAGTEVRGLDLRVRTSRLYSVRGKAIGLHGEPVNGVHLMLHSLDSPDRTGRGANASSGTFEFHDVPPGHYVIRPGPETNSRVPVYELTALLPVTVGAADVEDLQLTFSPGAEVLGVVRLEYGSFSQRGVMILLEPVNGWFGGYHWAELKDAVFSLHGVLAGLYRVHVQGLLDGYYVKSIRRYGGRNLAHDELDLSSGVSGTLEILLSNKPAAISGTVHDLDGNPVADALVKIWMKDDPDVRRVNTDGAGHFSLRNLVPGEYRAIAFETSSQASSKTPPFAPASRIGQWQSHCKKTRRKILI
jgi:hypothetical protein